MGSRTGKVTGGVMRPVGFEEWMQAIALLGMAICLVAMFVLFVLECKAAAKRRRIRRANKYRIGVR